MVNTVDKYSWLPPVAASWGATRLMDVVDLVNGYPFASDRFHPTDGVPLVRIRDVSRGRTETFYDGKIPNEAWIYPGDLLVGMDGDFEAAMWSGPQAALNQRVCCLRPDEQRLTVGYLRFLLPGLLKYMNDLEYATTVKHLSSVELLHQQIPEPPLQVQRHIADFLDSETERIDEMLRLDASLVALAKERHLSLVRRWTMEGELTSPQSERSSYARWLPRVPSHWDVVPLKWAASRLITGITPPTSDDQYYDEGTVPWYGPSSFGEDLHVGEPVKLLNRSTLQDGQAREVPAGSVLIVCIGATLGRASKNEAPATTNQQITAVVPRADINGDFLAWQLKGMEGVFRNTAPNTTLPILNQGALGAYPVVVPPLEEQSDIADALNRSYGRLKALRTHSQQRTELLEERRQALIAAAVTGQLDVSGQEAA